MCLDLVFGVLDELGVGADSVGFEELWEWLGLVLFGVERRIHLTAAFSHLNVLGV